jgi:hypothetical protein
MSLHAMSQNILFGKELQSLHGTLPRRFLTILKPRSGEKVARKVRFWREISGCVRAAVPDVMGIKGYLILRSM